MKILFVAPRYHTNQSYIVKTLREKGHNVYFFVSRIGKIENHSTFIYWKELKDIKPDIIIIRPHAKIFSYLSALYGIMLGSKIIFYEQINSKYVNFNKSNYYFYNLIRKIRFYLPLFIFKAAWMTPLLDKVDNILPNKCYFVPFAVPISHKKEKINSPIHFVMVAKYQMLKRHSLLIKAFHTLKESYNFKVTFIGELSNDGYPNPNEHMQTRQMIEKEINQLGLNNHINFTDNLSHSKLMENYKKYDVFILPTNNDNAAISVLEANGQGLPVICSDMSGTDTYVKDNYNGFVFKSDNLKSLKNNIEYFLENPSSIYDMSSNSIMHAKYNFSNESYYSNLKKLLACHFNIQL